MLILNITFKFLSSAEYYLWLQQADAVTVIPRFLCIDLWTKITLPMLSVFLHTRLSALRVNNPRTKTGYFFGSFYLITRSSYEAVGTHKIVKHELVEDGALGAELKRRKFLIRMVRGESYVSCTLGERSPYIVAWTPKAHNSLIFTEQKRNNTYYNSDSFSITWTFHTFTVINMVILLSFMGISQIKHS